MTVVIVTGVLDSRRNPEPEPRWPPPTKRAGMGPLPQL